MDIGSRVLKFWPPIALGILALLTPAAAVGQTAPPAAPQNAPARITLDEAIDLALKHNHSLQASRTLILQNQAQEITANLRPNPTLNGDAQFLPLFTPRNFTSDYFDNSAQFDLGVGYLFERGKKRQHRLQAAKDQTAVTSAQVGDNERTLTFNVASQFITAILAQSNVELADTDLKSFQQTLDISEERARAGAMSEGDLLKIKLQLLQFQTDVSAAKLARIQAMASLRQLLGYESVAENYEVIGDLKYLPVKLGKDDLKAMALRQRPDVRAAQLGVTAAESQLALAQANGKRDVTASINYSHVAATSTASLFGNIEIPVFDRNQGEIAKAGFAITQAQEQERFASGQVMTDVRDAFEGVRANDQIVSLYRSGYLDQSQQSRDITEYAYRHGAASLLDFLDAERSYRATQLSYRQALSSYLLALEQLRQAVGTRSLP
jgi:cobalt-zinc-cadmium efflux system outer membrane protein